MYTANIIEVRQDNPTVVSISVTFADVNSGQSLIRTYNYTNGNLDNKQQVLDGIQADLDALNSFQVIVNDLQAVTSQALRSEQLNELSAAPDIVRG